ncbi:unnamed protein product, partial [Mycena citricolor]
MGTSGSLTQTKRTISRIGEQLAMLTMSISCYSSKIWFCSLISRRNSGGTGAGASS